MGSRQTIQVGDKVVFLNAEAHAQCPRWYPPAGTVGRVLQVGRGTARVQWPAGCTGGSGRWYAPLCELALRPERLRRLLAAACRNGHTLWCAGAHGHSMGGRGQG